jgi:hypothetical protein
MLFEEGSSLDSIEVGGENRHQSSSKIVITQTEGSVLLKSYSS